MIFYLIIWLQWNWLFIIILPFYLLSELDLNPIKGGMLIEHRLVSEKREYWISTEVFLINTRILWHYSSRRTICSQLSSRLHNTEFLKEELPRLEDQKLKRCWSLVWSWLRYRAWHIFEITDWPHRYWLFALRISRIYIRLKLLEPLLRPRFEAV